MIQLKLDDDMLVRVFEYLAPNNLIAAEMCCKRWQVCANRNHLWQYHNEMFWDKVTYNKPSKLILFDRVKQLSMSELKQALSRVNTMNCLEKLDYQRALAARLLLRNRVYFGLSLYKAILPEWSLNMNPFKASYYFARSDVLRSRILLSELCEIKWWFVFKHSESESGWEAKFEKDFSMQSELHDAVFEKFLDSCDPAEGCNRLQVEQYPVLTVSRRGDGAWQMENMYVRFTQLMLRSDKRDLPLV